MENLSLQANVSEQLADYFIVCGLSDNPKDYDASEVLFNGEEIVLSDTGSLDFSRYPRPIVDVQIINRHGKEELPYGYTQLIKTHTNAASASLNGRNTDELYICYRRGFDRPPIGDIGIAPENKVKKNCTLIKETVGGNPATLIKTRLSQSYVFLSYNRVPDNYGVDQLALTELCFIMKSKGEVCPMGYMECSQKLSGSQYGSELYLCYKKSLVKPHIATYQPEVLTWYEVTQSSASDGDEEEETDKLDGESSFQKFIQHSDSLNPPSVFNNVDIGELANFCLPWGAAIESWSIKQSPPRPVFFTFVITNASYQKLYGSALTFYEPFNTKNVDKDLCYRLNLEPELVFTSPEQREQQEEEVFASPEEKADVEMRLGVFRKGRVGDRVLGMTKTICFLSRHSFGNSFKPFLQFLRSRCFANDEVENAKLKIPLERYLAFILHELSFQDFNTHKLTIDLDGFFFALQSPEDHSPASSISICELILLVGSELCLKLMVQLLTEQKLLLISVRPDLLAHTIQALTNIIHPLRWVLVYIPFIHMRCIHVVQSPSPFLIGVDSRFFEFFRLPGCEGITCVDLDTRNFLPAKNNPFRDTKCLPKGPIKKLRNALNAYEEQLMKINVRLQEQAETGVKCNQTINDQSMLIGKKIRHAFLTFMAELLKNYRKFLLPVGSSNAELLFNVAGFAKAAPDHTSRPFYRALCGTQLWSDFVRDLTYVSERNSDLEVFDRFIAEQDEHFHESGSSVVSSADSGSGSGSLGVTKRGPLTEGAVYPTPQPGLLKRSSDALLEQLPLNSSASSLSKIPHPSVSTMIIPGPSDADDGEFTSDEFTWTQWGNFPTSLNQRLLHRMRRRILRRQLAAISVSSSSLTSLLQVRAPSMQALLSTNHNASTLSLNSSEICAPLLLASAVTTLPQHTADEFKPKCEFIGVTPPVFCPGNGVAEVLGLGKLNALLKRTQQEATDSLIYAGRCRQVGVYAWANLLFCEVYSLWFLLLPSFLTSLHHQQHATKEKASDAASTAAAAVDLCYEARDLLTQAINLFFRLHQLPLHFVDQVSVRVLVALLYEYGRSDKGITTFWQSCVLNATSYAMANQLQRDLGLKLAAYETREIAGKLLQDDTTSHPDGGPSSVLSYDTDPKFIPPALSTPQVARDNSVFNIDKLNDVEDSSQAVGVDSSHRHLQPQHWASSSVTSQACPPSTPICEETDSVKSLGASKKGWRNFTMKSIKSITSMSIQWDEPSVISLTPSLSAVTLSSNLDSGRSSSAQRQTTKPVGYMNLFGKHLRQIHDDEDCRVRQVDYDAPLLMTEGAEEPVNANSSWLQGIRSEITRKLISMSPAPQRHVRNGSGGDVGNSWATPRGSITQVDEAGATGVPIIPATLGSGGSFDQPDVPPAYSWHEIAGSLAVGALSDRMCLANPTIVTSAGSKDCQLRSRFVSTTTSQQRRHNRRSSSYTSSPVNDFGDAVALDNSRQRISPAASSPVLPTNSRLMQAASSSSAAKPPLPSTFPRQHHLSLTTAPLLSSSTSAPPSPKALELRVIMTTCMSCPGCLRPVYDEEVMAEWAQCESNEFAIRCPHCRQRHEFIPRLTIRTVAIGESIVAVNELAGPQGCRRSSSPDAGLRKVPFSHGLIEYSLAYLNPFLLRKELESFLAQSSSAGTADCMAVEGLSSVSLLSGGRHDTLLWNLVYYFHRVGLPTHLLDAYPAWLMDCQAEVRRLGTSSIRRCLKGITMTKALADIILSKDLPVWLVAKWDMFPWKGVQTQPLYRLWGRQNDNGGESAANESIDSGCAPDEVVRMAGDALKFSNTEAAFIAILTQRRSGTALLPDDTKGSLSSLLQTTTSRFSPEACLYRELFLLFIRIHGMDAVKIIAFEEEYRRVYDEFLKSDSDRLSRADASPSPTTLACRTLFRNLILN